MANQLNKYGITIEAQTPSNISTHLSGSEDTVLLYASGSGADARLYVKSGANTQKQLGVDIDQYSALGGTALHDSQDHFLFSDNGTEKKITWANLYGAVFGKVSGDATVAAGGGLTIANGAVEQAMIADDAVGADQLASDAVVNTSVVNGSLKADKLDLDGSTDIGGDLADADLMLVDDGANGTNRKSALSRMKKYIYSAMSGDATASDSGVLTIAAGAVENSMLADDAVGADELASNAVVNASVAANAAIDASKLDFNVNFDGDITFGNQADDRTTFTGPVTTGHFTASYARITNLDAVTINSVSQTETTLEISDKLIVAALSASSANSDGGGLRIGGGQDSNGNASVLYDHANLALDFNIGGTTEVRLQDGVFRPETDNDVDLGAPGAEFKDLHLDGTANIDSLVADTADINGGTIDGATIATSDITVGSGKTLNVSGGTLTLANDQIAAAKVTGLDGAGLADASGVLSVNVDDSTIEIDSDSLRVKADGINSSHIALGALDAEHYASGSIETGHLAARAVTNAKIANDAVNSAQIALGALDAEHYSSGSIENGHLAGSIANAKLSNSTITIAGDSGSNAVDLGDTLTVAGTANEVDTSVSGDRITIGLPASVAITTGLTVPTCGVTTVLAVGGGYGSTGLTVDASGNLTMDGNLTVGVDGTASDAAFYGASSGLGLFWDGDNSRLGLDKQPTDADYAIDVKAGSGDVRADAFVTYSDRELKHNIVAIDDSLDKIMKLDAVSYDMKKSGRHEIGFIAQEVAKVVPEICALDSNGVGRGIDYGRLTSLLAGAVKTQQNQIAELKAAIAKLDK